MKNGIVEFIVPVHPNYVPLGGREFVAYADGSGDFSNANGLRNTIKNMKAKHKKNVAIRQKRREDRNERKNIVAKSFTDNSGDLALINAMSKGSSAPKDKKSNLGIIVGVSVAVLALIGVGVYAYKKSKK